MKANFEMTIAFKNIIKLDFITNRYSPIKKQVSLERGAKKNMRVSDK
jgi:hypothetical protein